MIDHSAEMLNAIDPVSAVTQIGTATANTIAGISDMNKRREFDQALQSLTNSQQQELNEKLLSANTQNDRLRILSESMTNYLIANQAKGTTSNIFLYAIAGVLAIGLFVGVIYLSKSK